MNTTHFFFTLLLMSSTVNAQELSSFRENSKYGFKDAGGKIMIPAKYTIVFDFTEGLAVVGLNGKYGFIDQSGKEIIPVIYNRAASFSEGLASVKLGGLSGYINQTGKIIIPLKYEIASDFMNGMATVWMNRKSFLIDKTGKALTSQKYDGAASFSEGLSMVYIGKYPNTKYGFVDITGKEIVPLVYDGAEPFSEGLAPVKRNGKWGFIDKTGKLVIALQYDHAGIFSENLSPVNIGGKIDNDGFFNGGKSGFIDKTGKLIIPLQYDKAKTFTTKGVAPVLLNGKWGIIDKTGKALTAMSFSELDAIRLSVSDDWKNKYNITQHETARPKPATQANKPVNVLNNASLKELSNVFSKTYNYQREWLGTQQSSGDPTSEKIIANVIFNVTRDEIKVYTGNGNLEDTHTITASKYSSHPKYGRGKLYKAKSKKHNTIADFIFFDDERYGLLIPWKTTFTQYLFARQ